MINKIFKESFSFALTTALSCGPSQAFGLIKGLVDTILLSKALYQQRHQTFSSSFKRQQVAEKISRLQRALLADGLALIPVLGAHLSWRVATQDYRLKFSPIFERGTTQLFEHPTKLISLPVFPLTNESELIYIPSPLKEFTKTRIKVTTSEGTRFLNSYHYDKNKGAPTVVIFAGNTQCAESMMPTAKKYVDQGFNALTVTIGGYKGSPGVWTSEESLYQDVEAIKLYLQQAGVTQVAYHGYSLGGSLAFQAAVGKTNATKLETLFVVADKTFSSAVDVGGNPLPIIKSIGKGHLAAGIPKGRLIELPNDLWTRTDGLDNHAKAERLRERNIPLYAIQADRDILMGRKYDKKKRCYTHNFAQDLLKARYHSAQEEQQTHLFTSEGGHGDDCFTKEFQNRIVDVAKKLGLLPE